MADDGKLRPIPGLGPGFYEAGPLVTEDVSYSLKTAVARGVGRMGQSLGHPPDVVVVAIAAREGDAKIEYGTNGQKYVVQRLLTALLKSLEES